MLIKIPYREPLRGEALIKQLSVTDTRGQNTIQRRSLMDQREQVLRIIQQIWDRPSGEEHHEILKREDPDARARSSVLHLPVKDKKGRLRPPSAAYRHQVCRRLHEG